MSMYPEIYKSKLRRSSLAVKVSFLVSIFFIASMILLGVIIFSKFSAIMLQSIKKDLSNRIKNEAHVIYGELFSRFETTAYNYAQLISNIGFDDLEILEGVSKIIISSDEHISGGGFWLEPYVVEGQKFYGPYWFSENGQIKMTWEYSNEKNDYRKFSWYQSGKLDGTSAVWSGVYNDEITGVPMLTVTSVLSDGIKKLGVVTIDLGIEPLTEYFSSIDYPDIKKYSLYLVNKEGICLNSRNKELIGKNIITIFWKKNFLNMKNR